MPWLLAKAQVSRPIEYSSGTRFYIRAALGYHDLSDFAANVEIVTSELVTNAIAHASARTIHLELTRLEDPAAVMVVVTDSSPLPRSSLSDFAGDLGIHSDSSAGVLDGQ